MIFFTICSNNYLAQVQILELSIRKFHPESEFVTVLVDKRSDLIDYERLKFEILFIEDIVEQINELSLKYDVVELNTCVKPAVFEYLFEKKADRKVVYMDPDTKLFSAMSEVEGILEYANIVLTPHVNTPIPLDGRSPAESMFLNFGIFNLGFLALAKCEETVRFNDWWKERTFHQGYSKVAEGLFVDQLFINLAPVFFGKVHILKGNGYNMAPWNLHERKLSLVDDRLMVNGTDKLVFYHFSSFRVDSNELPIFYYDRYTLAERSDLEEIYFKYNEEIKSNRWSDYSRIRPFYSGVYDSKKIYDKDEKIKRLPVFKKFIFSAVQVLPETFRKRIGALLLH